ncbi:MAG: fibronectin type III domain-containing protein, partial [Candidatus Paceibacterota bacterium]
MFFSQKKIMKKGRRNGGFTIIELMVSLALFTATFIAISSSFISIVDAYRRIMAERVNVDNLSTAVESMVRGLKTGTSFHCGLGGDINDPQDCPSGDTYLAFKKATDNKVIVYRLAGEKLERSDDAGFSFFPVTDVTNVKISDLKFYVTGSIPFDNDPVNTDQPKVVIVMRGTVGQGTKRSSSFSIQTTITQRLPDLEKGGVVAGDTTPPTTPTNLSATAADFDTINLTWTASSDPDSGVSQYRIERCLTSSCTYAEIGTSVSASYVDSLGLSGSTSYTYRVLAVNGAGLTSVAYSGTATETTPAAVDTTPPSDPDGLSATAISSSRIDLTWNAASDPDSGISGYRVDRCLTSSCTYSEIGTPSIPSYSNTTGLNPSTSYTYRVKAVNGAGIPSVGYSPSASATTLSAGDTTPPTVSISAPTNGATVSGAST